MSYTGPIVSVGDGGTGVNTLTTAFGVVCAGTTATAPVQNAGSGLAGEVLTSNGAAALPTFQAVPSIATPISLANGGTAKALVAANGGIVYSDADSFEILAPTSTANQPLLSGASGAPGWSTATYPGSTTANQLLYSSAANTIGGLATANNGTLVTSATGVPSILAGPGSTGRVFQSNAAAAPSFSTATYPSVATGTGTILRADGTNWVATTATYPTTTTVSQIPYSSSANVIGGITTANSSLLKTNGSGVPSMTTTGSVTETNGQFNWPLQPAFRATLSADPTNVTGAGTAYTIVFNTEAFDQNSDFDATTGIFTAPVTGIYHFDVTIFMYGIVAATAIDITIRNSAGTTIGQLSRTAGLALSSATNYAGSWSATLLIASAGTAKVVLAVSGEAGDVIDILSGSNQTSFSGYLVA